MEQSMKRIFIVGIFVGILTIVFALAQEQTKKPEQKEKPSSKTLTYKKDIAPVFKKYCLPCHTEDQMNPSELYLDSYENIMTGGKHGKPLMVGKPDSSILIQKTSAKPPFGDPMPMKRKVPFPEDTLGMLKAWIKEGAKEK